MFISVRMLLFRSVNLSENENDGDVCDDDRFNFMQDLRSEWGECWVEEVADDCGGEGS
jgi:hypothetical protein